MRLPTAVTASIRQSPGAYASAYTPVVRTLQCLRGISTLTAFGLAVEIGGWDRFKSRSQGSITKTGNSHARRLLVEAARHHRSPSDPRSELVWVLVPTKHSSGALRLVLVSSNRKFSNTTAARLSCVLSEERKQPGRNGVTGFLAARGVNSRYSHGHPLEDQAGYR